MVVFVACAPVAGTCACGWCTARGASVGMSSSSPKAPGTTASILSVGRVWRPCRSSPAPRARLCVVSEQDHRDSRGLVRRAAKRRPVQYKCEIDARVVELSGAYNVRDLGGVGIGVDGQTRRGLIFRGDSLDSLTPADEVNLFHDCKIGVLIDLRTPEESGGDGLADQRRYQAASVYSCPVVPEGHIGREPFPAGDPRGVAQLYLGYVENRRDVFSQIIEILAEAVGNGTPSLFHCAAGRDRTGVVAAVLFLVLGARWSDIVSDYVCSNRRGSEVAQRLAQNPLYKIDRPAIAGERDRVNGKAMLEFLRLFNAKNGGIDRWAAESGISAKIMDRLRASMVER